MPVAVAIHPGECEAPLKTELVSSNLPHRAECTQLKKTQSRSNGYYSVFLSILNTNNNASKGNLEPEYSYRQAYIRVNNQQQATTDNKDQFIMYSIQTGEQEMVYAGFLPKNKELKNAITRSLFHRFTKYGIFSCRNTIFSLK